MPIVVRMAMVEAMTRKTMPTRSTKFRARKSERINFNPKVIPKIARQSTNTNLAAALICNSVL